MSLTYEEALAQITGPGQVFEVIEDTVDGRTLRVFKHAPPTVD